jgi:predicted GNAT family N-acyltransferase
VFSQLKPLPPEVKIRPADWSADENSIANIRRRVFIEEQSVPDEMEWETIDPECAWFVAQAADGLVGIARLTSTGRIGRMAVLAGWRGKGIGSSLLVMALDAARQRDMPHVVLHAQSHAIAFYQRFGFAVAGSEFMEAGIPHRVMELDLRGH